MTEQVEKTVLRKTTIGGQALIEGLMMVGPEKKAMAVRNPQGEIILEYLSADQSSALEKVPFIRGPIKVFKQLVLGTKAMMRSAEIAEPEENTEKMEKAETENERTDHLSSKKTEQQKEKKKSSQIGLYLSVIVSILLSVFLFMLLPGLLVDLIQTLWKIPADTRQMHIWLTLLEGVVRVGIFLLYLWAISKIKDIKRVLQYHGSEHKTIACYEAKQELTVENIRRFSRYHPRCGTSFMFLIMIISIIVLALIGWHNRLINLVIRLLILPVIASISYEIIRVVGRYDNALTGLISKPGLALQRLTTAEPDDSMIEVAIVAMEAVLPTVEGSDEW